MYLLEWKVLSYQTKVNLLDFQYGPILYIYEVFSVLNNFCQTKELFDEDEHVRQCKVKNT